MGGFITMDSIEDLKNKIDKFNKARDWDQFHSPANLAKSIVLEAIMALGYFLVFLVH